MSDMCPCCATDCQTKVENQGKPLKYSEKSCISHQLRADIQSRAIDFNTQLMIQQRLMCVPKNARLLLPHWYGKWDPLQNQHLTATYSNCWIGWGGPVAWPPSSLDLTPMDFFLWGHIKARFTSHQLILKRILFPVLLSQQQPSGSILAFLSAYISLCRVVGGVSWLMAVCLNICSKLIRSTTFFFPRILQWFCLISYFRPNLTVRSAARTYLRHIVSWQ